MAWSKTTELYPTGNVQLASFTTASSTATVVANTNITAIYVQAPSGTNPLFLNVTTANAGSITPITVNGQNTNGIVVLSGGSYLINVGKANSAFTTVYVNGATSTGFANVYITPMA